MPNKWQWPLTKGKFATAQHEQRRVINRESPMSFSGSRICLTWRPGRDSGLIAKGERDSGLKMCTVLRDAENNYRDYGIEWKTGSGCGKLKNPNGTLWLNITTKQRANQEHVFWGEGLGGWGQKGLNAVEPQFTDDCQYRAIFTPKSSYFFSKRLQFFWKFASVLLIRQKWIFIILKHILSQLGLLWHIWPRWKV